MALNDYVQLSELGVTDFDSGQAPGAGNSLNTGDLRRKYNFGDRVSELAIAQDPFFRFVSKVSKKPTDDPQFKFTEKRGSYHKRYAYVGAAKDNAGAWVTTSDLGAAKGLGDSISLRMLTDYKNQGNIQNVHGNTDNEIKIGAAGTCPKFFLPGQLVKVPVATSAAGAVADYMIVKITASPIEYTSAGTGDDATASSSTNPDMVEISGTVVRVASTAANNQFLTALANSDDGATVTPADDVIHSELEQRRCYVMGSAHGEGEGYPETWKDQPYSTAYGRTQIWKTSCAMTNTARATSLKYEGNEWARVWKEKLIEHKFDLESSLLFGSQSDDYYTTQGAVDYILGYGNQFTLATGTKTADSFLDDMSSYKDPRYNNGGATVFFVSTAVYNWMHKLGGYIHNNLSLGNATDNRGAMYTADFAMTGKKKVLGVDITTFSTPYGDMNVARNIHLDGTNIAMLGIDMKNCAYRPLVGNGLNRDTSVYVGVQTLENSGVDRRVDLILTEAGMEWSMPESHAVWLNA